jgi:hypothetical protein
MSKRKIIRRFRAGQVNKGIEIVNEDGVTYLNIDLDDEVHLKELMNVLCDNMTVDDVIQVRNIIVNATDISKKDDATITEIDNAIKSLDNYKSLKDVELIINLLNIKRDLELQKNAEKEADIQKQRELDGEAVSIEPISESVEEKKEESKSVSVEDEKDEVISNEIEEEMPKGTLLTGEVSEPITDMVENNELAGLNEDGAPVVSKSEEVEGVVNDVSDDNLLLTGDVSSKDDKEELDKQYSKELSEIDEINNNVTTLLADADLEDSEEIKKENMKEDEDEYKEVTKEIEKNKYKSLGQTRPSKKPSIQGGKNIIKFKRKSKKSKKKLSKRRK